MNITQIVIAWLVTSVSFFVISKLPFLGVEIYSFQISMISAAVFGLLNAFVMPVLHGFFLPMKLIFSDFLLALILNAIIFGLAAWLVDGFRLRWGFWSALLGAIALSFINSVLYQVLASVKLR